jgi:hypothetical protein
MAIFNSYVKLLEGKFSQQKLKKKREWVVKLNTNMGYQTTKQMVLQQ